MSPYDGDKTKTFCEVEFLEDHPYGYPKGDKGGGYILENLVLICHDHQDDGQGTPCVCANNRTRSDEEFRFDEDKDQ
jgi:hypothetical protein